LCVSATLIVWRLDRLGRNMRAIINTLHELTQRGVTVRSLHDGVYTSTSTGRMVGGILVSIAEYEREPVREDPVGPEPSGSTRHLRTDGTSRVCGVAQTHWPLSG
jgi:hypothetical protein